jgi:hypothetical protein
MQVLVSENVGPYSLVRLNIFGLVCRFVYKDFSMNKGLVWHVGKGGIAPELLGTKVLPIFF